MKITDIFSSVSSPYYVTALSINFFLCLSYFTPFLIKEPESLSLLFSLHPLHWGSVFFFLYGAAAWVVPLMIALAGVLFPLFPTKNNRYGYLGGAVLGIATAAACCSRYSLATSFQFTHGGVIGEAVGTLISWQWYLRETYVLLFLLALSLIFCFQRYAVAGIVFFSLWLLRGMIRGGAFFYHGIFTWFFYFFPSWKGKNEREGYVNEVTQCIDTIITTDIAQSALLGGITPNDTSYLPPALQENLQSFLPAESTIIPSFVEEEAGITGEAIIALGKKFGIALLFHEQFSGPTVETILLKIECPHRLATLLAHATDFSYFLEAPSLRIVYPIHNIPGVVGFEYQKKKRILFSPFPYFSQETFRHNEEIPLFLGLDTKGVPLFFPLHTMAHVLIAGATGSGKSSFMHALITSILWKQSSDEVQFFFIDPKRVEFFPYQSLPHTIHYARTDQEITQTLDHCLRVMEERYQLLESKGIAQWQLYQKNYPEKKKESPFIVVFVDEYAEIILENKEQEKKLLRLSQMARAAGIQLIISTQRPSVDVVSPVLKANLLTRISFRVSSVHDSKVILGQTGAEKLLGSGDGLLTGIYPYPIRFQAPFVGYDTIETIIAMGKIIPSAEQLV